MGKMKKLLSVMLSVCCVFAAIPGICALADSSGEKVITLGADLSAEQKTTMLKYFGVEGQDIKTLTVTNADERDFLGDFISLDEIGTRTYSCALVQPTTSGGIQVKTANLTYVSSDMIASSLSTCGVVNCQVLAAAPFAVSGTGALTGILMSYETSTGKQLKPKRVKAATREMITTARFGRRFGRPRATLIVNRAKIQVIQNKVTNVKDITNIINNVSVDLNVTLSDEEIALLTDLLEDISELSYTDEEIEQMQQNVDQVEENASAEMEAEDSSSGDIMMYTDDSALGDDATFDSSGIMTLDLPRTEEELEYESEAGLEEEEESELESDADAALLAEVESEAESEAAAEAETETAAESEAETEVQTEKETEAATESAKESEQESEDSSINFFNTDESILGEDVAIDVSIPEEEQAEESEEETQTEAAEESEKETEAETAEESEEPDTEAAEETEEPAESDAQIEGPADPSAFLPQAQTEAKTDATEAAETAETEEAEEVSSFVLGSDDMPKEESAPAEGEASDTENTAESAEESSDDDNLFKSILASVVEDGSSSEPSESADTSDASDTTTADDSFAQIFEDSAESSSDGAAESAVEEAPAEEAPSVPFTEADLSFSPNGTTVEPDLTTLSISCGAGGLSAGGGSLTVYSSDGAAVSSVPMSSASVSSTSATVTIGSVLAPNTSYYVILSSDALRKDGVSLEGTSGSWTFSTSGSDEPEEAAEGEEVYEDDWGDEDWGDDFYEEDWDW